MTESTEKEYIKKIEILTEQILLLVKDLTNASSASKWTHTGKAAEALNEAEGLAIENWTARNPGQPTEKGERLPIYVAFLDAVPSLSLQPHEVCEEDPLTSEDIVAMWSSLKAQREVLLRALKGAFSAMAENNGPFDPEVWSRAVIQAREAIIEAESGKSPRTGESAL